MAFLAFIGVALAGCGGGGSGGGSPDGADSGGGGGGGGDGGTAEPENPAPARNQWNEMVWNRDNWA